MIGMEADKQKKCRRPFKPSERLISVLIILGILIALAVAVNYYLGDPLQMMHACPTPRIVYATHVPSSPTPDPSTSLSPAPETETPQESAAPAGVVDLYFIDVGQGDCIFLRSPDGSTMLIDAGERGNFDTIDDFLKHQGVEDLDVVVATHAHSDHIGSMAEIIDSYDIGTFYMPSYGSSSKTYTDMLEALKENDVDTVTVVVTSLEEYIPWDPSVELHLLSPLDVSYGNCNDSSIVLHVAYGESSALLTGDAEDASEKLQIKAFPNHYFKATVLKLGHHGSSSSTSEKYLLAVKPSIVVASLGQGNKYGHPHAETLELLAKYGLTLYRTDELGTIHIILDGVGASVVE